MLAPMLLRLCGTAGGPLPENDAALLKIIGRHFDDHPITHDGTDTETPHLPRRIGDQPMTIFQDDTEAPIRVNFVDLAVESEQFLFGHPVQAGCRLTADILPRRSSSSS